MDDKKVAVRKMQRYISEHLYELITLKVLSRVAGYSPYYAARLFKEVTGYSPYNYIKRYRLSQAALAIRDEESHILDVALDHFFDSHEGFTRAFSKQFGLNPSAYRQNKPPIALFTPYVVDVDQKRRRHMGQTVFTQVIERPKRKALIKRAINANEYFSYCEEVGCDVWGILMSVKEALYEPIGMWLPLSMRPEGTSEYVQGVEVPLDYDNLIPDGYELIDLEPCKIMIFQGEPFEEAYFEDSILEVIDAIKKFKPEVYGYKWAEHLNPRFQLEPQEDRGYIEGRPIIEL